jgi:hypothetical protein
LHVVENGIEWAETHGTCLVLDRQIKFTAIGPYPAAEVPRSRLVGIERQCPVDESGIVIKVTVKLGERVPAPGQSDRVILAQLDGPLGEPRASRGFMRAVDYPAIEPSPDVAPGGHIVRRRAWT